MHKLTENFTAFFKRINPSLSYEQIAARAQAQITNLIEDKAGPAGDLRIKCFLQGSYRRDTAIHTINDVDIVALCSLSHSSNANYNTRNQIFGMIAKAIAKNKVYSDKIKYRNRSICIKILLEGVKIEILPALRMKGQNYTFEPFYIFQPEIGSNGNWIEAFARQHQKLCTKKNSKTLFFLNI
ncbi:nucleotidyltransferase [candidate division KSB1 bacterium]|nr:nucleotidyltransferase [candidate division KSB1 bacterium]